MNLFRLQKGPREAVRFVYRKIPIEKVRNKRFLFHSSDFGHEQKNPLVNTTKHDNKTKRFVLLP